MTRAGTFPVQRICRRGPGSGVCVLRAYRDGNQRHVRAEVHDIVGGSDHVAVVVHSTGERPGKRLDHWRVDLFHPGADGRIQEFWAIWIDQAAVDDFWAEATT